MGMTLVMALTEHCYFDVAESNTPGEVKAATWLKPISLEKVYQLDPMIEGLDEKISLSGFGCSCYFMV